MDSKHPKVVHARKHDMLSGTAETTLDGVKGAAQSTWNWGRVGMIAGGVALMLVMAPWGAGLMSLIPNVAATSALATAASFVTGAVGLVVGAFGGGALVGGLGTLFGGVKGAGHGLDRVADEHKAYRVNKAIEHTMGVQAQQVQTQAMALHNIAAAQQMQQEVMMQADAPTMRVAGAQKEEATELTPSANMQESVPGLKEAAANDNNIKDMLEALRANDNEGHAAKHLAEIAAAEQQQEATR